jgi:hypothetical protein
VRQYGAGIHSHAGTILWVACRARNRAIKECANRTASGEVGVLTDDAITAIVLAAAAAEAFINELADNIGLIRKDTSGRAPLDAAVYAASDAILDADFLRKSVVEKYVDATKALKASPFKVFEHKDTDQDVFSRARFSRRAVL